MSQMVLERAVFIQTPDSAKVTDLNSQISFDVQHSFHDHVLTRELK